MIGDFGGWGVGVAVGELFTNQNFVQCNTPLPAVDICLTVNYVWPKIVRVLLQVTMRASNLR